MNTSHSPFESTSCSRRDFLTKSFTSLTLLSFMGNPLFAQKDFNSVPTIQPLLDKEGFYTLPPLSYPYNALEPFIDEQTMRLHHDIHFAAYMNGLNDALKALDQARKTLDFTQVSAIENQLAFNGAGYFLHTVFFQNMAPAPVSPPSVWLLDKISKDFRSLEAFKAHFSAVALGVQGSGWAILGYEPLGQKMVILQVEKHQNATLWNIIPLLVLDVWEHAYYLKYQNKRKDYIQNWWNIVNWANVEARLKPILIPQVAQIDFEE